MSIPIFTFAAYSGTGKTTYIEKLVASLKARGLRVAVIKHDAHHLEIDKKGKDSWRFTQAGADVVALSSTDRFVLLQQSPVELDELISHIHDVDIILTEGWKTGPWPKIAIYRKASGSPLAVDEREIFALVTDTDLGLELPTFPLDDSKPLADYLMEYIQA